MAPPVAGNVAQHPPSDVAAFRAGSSGLPSSHTCQTTGMYAPPAQSQVKAYRRTNPMARHPAAHTLTIIRANASFTSMLGEDCFTQPSMPEGLTRAQNDTPTRNNGPIRWGNDESFGWGSVEEMMWRLRRATTTTLFNATPDPRYIPAQPTTIADFGFALGSGAGRSPAKIPLMLPILRMEIPWKIKKHPIKPA